MIKVVDLFAGPGGLAEGFARFKPNARNRSMPFEVCVSAEKDKDAHATLRLRAFYRLCERDGKVPDTTPEKAWQALVDTDMMREWWVDPKAGCARVNVSDWKPGSRWEHTRVDGSGIVDIVGEVVEHTPPRRLVFTWARPEDVEDVAKHSRVAFDIEPYSDGLVRLTVTHDDLEHDPKMLAGISGGWPTVLSNLKTFLETGRALPRTPSEN